MGSALYGSESATLWSENRSSVLSAGNANLSKYKEIEIPREATPGISKAGDCDGSGGGGVEGEEVNVGAGEEGKVEEDEVKYPGPLGLFILITGIALSVFLISLDRTIITTVGSPFRFQIMEFR